MKRYLFLTFQVLFFHLLSGHLTRAETWFQTRWVNDGDTIVLMDGRHVRFTGINAPEIEHENQKAEPYGCEAKSFNKKLVYQKNIRLEYDREQFDQYGRLLAYVFLENNLFVNAEILTHGYAFYLYAAPNLKYDSRLLKSQRDAMSQKRGIWQKWKESKATYVGNKKSKRFHLPTCPFADSIKIGNRVFFSTKWDAFWAGYAPAKKCIKAYWSYE